MLGMSLRARRDTTQVILEKSLRAKRDTTLVDTRRVPVQRAVERDEIRYPYKVHDTTLRPLLNITIKSTIVVRGRAAVATSAGQLPHKDRM